MSEWCGTGGDVPGMSQSSRLLPPQTEWKSPVPVKGREQPSVTLHTWWRHLVSRDKNHQISTYRVEPYVVAADVYGVAPHTGRGGWTWYTGSAGWMYRLITESLLGLHLEVDKLYFTWFRRLS